MKMLIISIVASLCLAADLKRKRDDTSDYSETKLRKLDTFSTDVWHTILSTCNFDIAPELAMTNKALHTVVPTVVCGYLIGKSKANELLDVNTIFCLLPSLLFHLKSNQNNINLPSLFVFLFKHADDHDFASKIINAWRSLDMGPVIDRALFEALQDSVGLPPVNPVLLYLPIVQGSINSCLYSYAYPTILLDCDALSNFIYSEFFQITLANENHGKRSPIAESQVRCDEIKKFVVKVWDGLSISQQCKILEVVSRTLLFYTSDPESAKFNAISVITRELVGCPLPKLSTIELAAAFETMDVNEFQDMTCLGNRFSFHGERTVIRSWVANFGCQRLEQLYASFFTSVKNMVEKKFELLTDYKSWGPSKLTQMTFTIHYLDPAGKLVIEIARHIWKLPSLDGMLVFFFITLSDRMFLSKSLEEFIDSSKDKSLLGCITGIHLKFIAVKKIEELNKLVRERAVSELLQMANLYEPGQMASSFDAKLVDPDIAQFLVMCIREEPALSSKMTLDALLHLLPSLNRFF